MDETTENFLKVMAEFEWPEIQKPIYRVYYDEDGHPTIYTMEDLPGNYIDISPEDFWTASMDSRVVDGRLVHPVKTMVIKLRPSDSGTSCHPENVSVVVAESLPHQKWIIR